MNRFNKVNKTIDKILVDKIISGEITLVDKDGVCMNDIPIKTSKYGITLSNNKQFMKKHTDRKLNILIKKNLSLLEKEILFDVLDYIDDENIIDFRKLAFDYEYPPSKISKVKKSLLEKGLLANKDGFIYLTPLIGYKGKEIKVDLIDLFKETFEKYGIEINYK